MTPSDNDNAIPPVSMDDKSLLPRIRRLATVAGRELIEKVLILYYVANDEKTSAWAKGVVGGAVAYFLFPLDAIPDLIPFAGFTDDAGVLAAALATLALSIRKRHIESARAKMREWFPSIYQNAKPSGQS